MEGTLRKDENGRWEIVGEDGKSRVFTSGATLEVCVGRHWLSTSIEHDGTDYYASCPGVRLVKGLPARVQ